MQARHLGVELDRDAPQAFAQNSGFPPSQTRM